MKKYMLLVLFIYFSPNLFAQDKKIDHLVYEYLRKNDLKKYPDNSIISVVCMSKNYNNVFLHFSILENNNLPELENNKTSYSYKMDDGNILFITSISMPEWDKSWQQYFDKNNLKEVSPNKIIEQFKFRQSPPTNREAQTVANGANCIIINKKEIWEFPAPKAVEATE